jgi:hypothetical protein
MNCCQNCARYAKAEGFSPSIDEVMIYYRCTQCGCQWRVWLTWDDIEETIHDDADQMSIIVTRDLQVIERKRQ